MSVKCSEFHASVKVLVGLVGTLHGVIEESNDQPFTKVCGVEGNHGGEAPQC